MLTLRARLNRRAGEDRVPSRAAEDGYAQPARPIRVILARDEELGLHADDDDSGGERDDVPAVQFPPPAYGLWRSSVVCWIGASPPPGK